MYMASLTISISHKEYMTDLTVTVKPNIRTVKNKDISIIHSYRILLKTDCLFYNVLY